MNPSVKPNLRLLHHLGDTQSLQEQSGDSFNVTICLEYHKCHKDGHDGTGTRFTVISNVAVLETSPCANLPLVLQPRVNLENYTKIHKVDLFYLCEAHSELYPRGSMFNVIPLLLECGIITHCWLCIACGFGFRGFIHTVDAVIRIVLTLLAV